MTKPEVYPVYQKLVISGSYVERYFYEKPYFIGFPRLVRKHKKIRKTQKSQESIRDDNVRRARQKIRRLINSNPEMLKFMTLTFDKPIFDLSEGNKIFNVFIKRLTRLYPDLKYIAVPEFQHKSKRVHYHLLVNIKDYISNDYLADNLWKNGFAWVRNTYNVDNLGAYVCKYLTKEIFDKRYFKKKKFFYSLNLLKPVVIDYIEEVREYIGYYFIDLFKPVFEFKFLTDFLGEVYYLRYNTSTLKVET